MVAVADTNQSEQHERIEAAQSVEISKLQDEVKRFKKSEANQAAKISKLLDKVKRLKQERRYQ